MEKLSKDELYLLALQLDLPDLLSFCESTTKFDKKICQDPSVWERKIKRDFPTYPDANMKNLLKHKSYKEIYELLYTKEKYYKDASVELFVTQNITLPEDLFLPNLEWLYIYFEDKMTDKYKVVIPESVLFIHLRGISVFPNKDGYYNVKIPKRFRHILEIQ